MGRQILFSSIRISKLIAYGFSVVLLTAIAAIYVSYRNSSRIIESEDWIIHTHEVLTQLGNIESRLLDLETGQRGYLITGKESYLEPFNSSLEIIYLEISSLREKTTHNPRQTERIDQLKGVIDEKIEELQLTIHLRRSIGYEAAKEIVNNDSGQYFMEELRALLNEIRTQCTRMLEIRSPKPYIIKKSTDRLLIGLLTLAILTVFIVFFVISRSINQQFTILRKGTEAVGKGDLDFKFRLRSTNEIGEIARSFEAMLRELRKTLMTNESLKKEIHIREETEKRLLHSQEQLLNINKELQQFTYITSHDLQEPLNSIISFLQFLEDEKSNLSEFGQKSVGIINDSAFRMKEFITSLLEYSRIGKEKTKVEVDIEKLIDNVGADLHSLVKNRNAKIEYVGKPLKLHAFETDLTKLFQNIIINGIKYTEPETSPKIVVDSEEQAEHFQFSIRDNGIGIDKKHFDKIFEVFQRLHTRDTYSGTGIGLAHCQKIVQLHDGKIWVESELGKGSTFYFTITTSSPNENS